MLKAIDDDFSSCENRRNMMLANNANSVTPIVSGGTSVPSTLEQKPIKAAITKKQPIYNMALMEPEFFGVVVSGVLLGVAALATFTSLTLVFVSSFLSVAIICLRLLETKHASKIAANAAINAANMNYLPISINLILTKNVNGMQVL
jgi:hypothetical protein